MTQISPQTDSHTSGGPRQFVPFVHALRGIASLIVVWSHLVGFWLYSTSTSWQPYTVFYTDVMLPLHLYQGGGHLGVVVFFLISGYIISMVAEIDSLGEFVIKRVFRVFRLFPVLFLSMVSVAAVNAALQSAGFASFPGSHIPTFREIIGAATLYDQIILGKNDVLTVTWTLVVEIAFYGLVAAIYPMMKTKPVKSTLIILGIGTLIYSQHANSQLVAMWGEYTLYLPLFIVGRIGYLAKLNRIDWTVAVLLFALTTMIFIQNYMAIHPDFLFTKAEVIPAYTYVQGMLIFFGAMLAGEFRSKLLTFFANISYSLYLLHLPVGLSILVMARDHLDYNLALPLAIAASTAAASLSWRFIEVPSQKVARTLSHLVKEKK